MRGERRVARARARPPRRRRRWRSSPTPTRACPGSRASRSTPSSGMSISLDRGPGGLVARRRDKKGKEQSWTVLGASRGEGGILGEGIRQALLRDPTYAGALACGEALLR